MLKIAIIMTIQVLVLFSSTFVFATPARVIIIRHAEKPADDSNPDLSPAGYARAQALTHLFSVHPEYAQPDFPIAYFATPYTPDENANRARETLFPITQEFGKKVQTPFRSKDNDKLAELILTSPEYDGKLVMIAWVKKAIPTLARAFGPSAAPKKWDGRDIFDRVWILDFTEQGIVFSNKPQSLMPGDSEE